MLEVQDLFHPEEITALVKPTERFMASCNQVSPEDLLGELGKAERTAEFERAQRRNELFKEEGKRS